MRISELCEGNLIIAELGHTGTLSGRNVLSRRRTRSAVDDTAHVVIFEENCENRLQIVHDKILVGLLDLGAKQTTSKSDSTSG